MGRAPAQYTSCLLNPVISGIGITHQGKPTPIGQLSLYHLFSTTIAFIDCGQKNRYACVYIAVFYDVLLDSLMFLIVHIGNTKDEDLYKLLPEFWEDIN